MSDSKKEPDGFEAVDSPYIFGPVWRREHHYYLTVNGVPLPHVEVSRTGEDEYRLHLDGRITSEPVTLDEINRWAPMLGHAMAISAGFTHCGPDSRPDNPFRCTIRGMSGPEYFRATVEVIQGEKDTEGEP